MGCDVIAGDWLHREDRRTEETLPEGLCTFSEMRSFYYRNKKQKAGRWQNELSGWSSVSGSWVATKCVWMQSLLLFLFCIACSCAPTESPTSSSASCTESFTAKPNFTVLNIISHPLEMPHSVTRKPVKMPRLFLRLLMAYSMEKRTVSVSSQKRYKQHRLFKRELENVSQNNSASASVLSEAQASSPEWEPRSEAETPSPEWVPRSEAETSFPEWVPFLDVKTFPAVKEQMLSTLEHITFATPEAMSSIGSIDKPEQPTDADSTFSVQSASTLPSTTQSLPYSNGKHIAKINYPSFSSSPFPVTDGTKGQTENGSYKLTAFTLQTSSGYRNIGPTELPTSNLKTDDQFSPTPKQATDRFDLLDMTEKPKPDTSTFSNMLIPNLESSTISLQYSVVPVTRILSTNSALGTSIGAVNTELYSHSSKPTISVLLDDSLQDGSWDLSSVTPLTLDITGQSSTTGHIKTKTPLNLDHNTADISHTTKQRIESSSVADGTSVGTFFASSTLAVRAEQGSLASTSLQTSKTAQTLEHARNFDQQIGTEGITSASTLKSPTISTAVVSHPHSWRTTRVTDINTISNVPPSPCRVENKGCVLQIHDPANTQTPKSSETLRLPSVGKSTDSASDTTVLSTISSVTTSDGSTLVQSTFINAYSEFQGTTTPTLLYDDAINENGKTNGTSLSLTSTLASARPSTPAKTSLTTVTSLWKSRTSQQWNSTIQPVHKIQTLWTTLYSTEANKPSQAPHKLYNTSTHYPTSMPAASQRTISSKSMSGLTASLVQTSTSLPSTKDHKPNLVTGPLSGVPSKTPTATSRTMTPLITSRLNGTLTIKETPAPKVWIPQTDFSLEPKIATAINYSARQEGSSAPTTITSLVSMPLNFHLAGVSFSEQLNNRSSEAYRGLEREVKLVMDKVFFATYENYLETEIKAFLKGSVIVQSNIVFQHSTNTPSASDIVRTVLTDGTKTNSFGWSINGSTVELNGFKMSNLALEIFPMSLLVLRAGYIAVSQKNEEKQSFLDNLQKAVFQAVNTSFPITNVSFSQIRDVYGDLELRGNLTLNSTVRTNVPSLMSSLLPLVNRSVDVSSIIVNGISNELQVYPINFRITNKQFVLNLLDMSSTESQLLSKNLSVVVQAVLHDSNPLQVIIREFKSGSVLCRGDLVFQFPAPGSGEVLRLFLKTLGSDGILGSSTYKVDFKSITIGDSSPGPSYEYIDFPGYGVAIIVMCGLSILIFPILLFVCIKTKMLGHRKKATIQRRHDLDDRSHHFEMDNQAFRASIEQP